MQRVLSGDSGNMIDKDEAESPEILVQTRSELYFPRRTTGRKLILDPAAGLDAFPIVVFDLCHLGDEVCLVDEILRGTPAGEDELHTVGLLVHET